MRWRSSSTLILHLHAQISLDPWRAHILYASFRQDSRVYAWDLRAGLGSDVPYCVYGDSPHRSDQRTNQRLRFDIDASGKLLGTGARVRRDDDQGDLLLKSGVAGWINLDF